MKSWLMWNQKKKKTVKTIIFIVKRSHMDKFQFHFTYLIACNIHTSWLKIHCNTWYFLLLCLRLRLFLRFRMLLPLWDIHLFLYKRKKITQFIICTSIYAQFAWTPIFNFKNLPKCYYSLPMQFTKMHKNIYPHKVMSH